jgi:microcystin-dependent protein
VIIPCLDIISRLLSVLDPRYASSNHDHDTDYSSAEHTHDERYYTEDEVDAMLAELDGAAIIGEIRMWPNMTAPLGWFPCVGQEVSRETYSDLYDVIGTTFGVGDGSTTFNLPDFTSRSPLGVDDYGSPYRPLGDAGGAATHTLSSSEMPVHNHGPGAGTEYWMRDTTGGSVFTLTTSPSARLLITSTTGGAGGGQAHNNMSPYLAVYFIIYAG